MRIVGVTCLFHASPQRLRNFAAMRAAWDAPLIVAELAQDANDHRLEHADLRMTGSRLWQKERMYNRVVECGLLAGYDVAVFLDADVVLAADMPKVLDSLRDPRVSAVQPYTVAHQLDSNGQSIWSRPAFAAEIDAHGADHIRHLYRERNGPACGQALAVRVSDLHPQWWLDTMVVGGADTAMMLIAAGLPGLAMRRCALSYEQVRMWRAPAWITSAPGVSSGLWHGSLEKRRYIDRHALTVDLDPSVHLCINETGGWQWTDEGRAAGYADRVTEYMESRE